MIRIRVSQFCSYFRSLLLTLGFVVMLSATCAPFSVHAQQGAAAADQAQLAQFQQSLDSLRRQYAIPGLSAAIVNNGRIIWEAGFGFQDVENQIPATPDTPYRIASITKTFASMLLMRCVERGALNLDTPIRNYTSGIADSRVTVRHLFTHTSQSSPPGEKYLYSGDRYNFLTPVVESCGGQSFREALAKTILDRLEMWDSVPGQDMEFPSPQAAALFTPETLQRYTRVIQGLAKPYVVDNTGRPILSAYPPRGIFAAAGLISTVRDLARYDAAIDQHILLQPQTQQQAWTNHVNSKGQSLPYALGWFVQMYGGERLIWHYGQWDTFSALFLKVPGRNITLILLANSSGLSAPFNALGAGNVTGSPFANLFLQMLASPTPTPTPTPTPQAPTLLTEEGTNRAVALDSVTFVVGPFSKFGPHNFSFDQRTRVMLFTSNLGLGPSDNLSGVLSVQIQGGSLLIERVGAVPGLTDTSYIIVRLDGASLGTNLPLTVTLRGVTSNTATIDIGP